MKPPATTRASLSPTKLEPVMAALNLELEQSPQAALLRVHAALEINNAREASLEQRLADAEARNALLVQQLAESHRAGSQLAMGMAEQYRAISLLHGLQTGSQCGGAASCAAATPAAATLVSPVLSVHPVLLETHTVRPSRIETPPATSQMRWLQSMEVAAATYGPSPPQPATQLAPPQQQNSPHSLLRAMFQGMHTPARTHWRRRLSATCERVCDAIPDEQSQGTS